MSGATDYKSLCIAAKTEERRLAELRKRRQYRSDPKQGHPPRTESEKKATNERSTAGPPLKGKKGDKAVRCWNCDELGHISVDCKAPRKEEKEGKVKSGGKRDKSRAQQVQSSEKTKYRKPISATNARPASTPEDPRQFLLPDSDGEESDAQVEEV